MLSRARLKYLRSLRQTKVRAAEGLLLLEGFNAIEEALRAGRVRELYWDDETARSPRARRLIERVGSGGPGAGDGSGVGSRVVGNTSAVARGGAVAGSGSGSAVAPGGARADGAHTSVLVGGLARADVEQLSQTRSPAGAFALAEDPCVVFSPNAWPDGAVALVAAEVADPGNLGTLIRTAAALGAVAVVITPGTVDPTNPKVVRASAGAVYRIEVARADADWAATLRASGVRVAVADAAGEPVKDWLAVRADSSSVALEKWVLAVGNEPRGLDAATRAVADARLAVPLAILPAQEPGGLDSLNVAVAAGILLYEFLSSATGDHTS